MQRVIERVAHMPFSHETRASCWHEAMCAADNCSFVAAPGFYCGVERDTQRQLWAHMPPDAVVLEVGARFGTISCTISKRQRYSGMRVSVEPDKLALDAYLTPNVMQNGCSGQQVWGVVDQSSARLPAAGGSYGTYANPDSEGGVPGRSIMELERLLPRAAHFSVLVLDCEGCAFRFIAQHEQLLRSPSLVQVYLEADGLAEADFGRYENELVPRMCALGLDVREFAPNLTGKPEYLKPYPIFHLVFERGGRCAPASAPTASIPSAGAYIDAEPASAAISDLSARSLRFIRDAIQDRHYGDHPGLVDGSSLPNHPRALSMAGERRLDHMVALLATAVAEGVPGHFIETGVWRGGMSFFAAHALELLELGASPTRLVYLCDSFSGIPDQAMYARGTQSHVRAESAGVEQDGRAHRLDLLNDNAEARVRADAKRFGIDIARRMRFVPGFFNVSLPSLLRREPTLAFSVIRLDGDTYWSTYEALDALYPRLQPGGFIILDDYVDWAGCRAAVDAYRTTKHIRSPIVLVPHRANESTRGAYWRKPRSASRTEKMPRCVGAPPGQLRVAGSFNPPEVAPAGPPAKKYWDANLPMKVEGRPAYQVYKCVEAAAEAPTTTELASPPGTRSNAHAVTCLLAGGLTNQENEVGNCLLVAAALKRQMLVPQPVVKLSDECTSPWCRLEGGLAQVNAGSQPRLFEQLWDVERLRACAMQTHGVAVAKGTSVIYRHYSTDYKSAMEANLTWARGDARVNWTFTRLRHAGDATMSSWRRSHVRSVAKPHAGLALPESAAAEARATLRKHIPPSVGLVVLPEPFFALSSSTMPNETCCLPSQHILSRAHAIRNALPRDYACLHARVEEDWYNYCCSLLELPVISFEAERQRKLSLGIHRPAFEEWVRNGARGAAPQCSTSHPPPPSSCYMSPDQIASIMRADTRLLPSSAVYVASGARSEMFSSVSSSFRVQRRWPTGGDAAEQGRLSYEDVLVDREVCRHARLPLFAHSRSTFSTLLSHLRGGRSASLVTVWYNKIGLYRSDRAI